MTAFNEAHNRQKEATTHITITAKKEGTDTGYEIDIDYSEKSIKLKNKAGFITFLPAKCVSISFTNHIYWLDVPQWLYNKNYAFFNS